MDNTANPFSFGGYFRILSGVLLQPKAFFSGWDLEKSWSGPLWAIFLSGSIFSIATVIAGMHPMPLVMALIFLINAVGMVFITSATGALVMVLLGRQRIAYLKLFSIYAYSSTAVLVLAWMPFMLWITEIWRWWLIGCGLVIGCGLSVRLAILIICISFTVLMLVFGVSLPLLFSK